MELPLALNLSLLAPYKGQFKMNAFLPPLYNKGNWENKINVLYQRFSFTGINLLKKWTERRVVIFLTKRKNMINSNQ